jgi:hypothetical protein
MSFSRCEADQQLIPTRWLLWAAAFACTYSGLHLIVPLGWVPIGMFHWFLLTLLVGFGAALPAAIGLFRIKSPRTPLIALGLRLLAITLVLLATNYLWYFLFAVLWDILVGGDPAFPYLLHFGLVSSLKLLALACLVSFALWLSWLTGNLAYHRALAPPRSSLLIAIVVLTPLLVFPFVCTALAMAFPEHSTVLITVWPVLLTLFTFTQILFWIAAAVLAAVLFLVLRTARHGLFLVTDTTCHRCGYSLPVNTSMVTCPECGWARPMALVA